MAFLVEFDRKFGGFCQNSGFWSKKTRNFRLNSTNKAEDWGLAQPGFSNGAAYADLDNDGDLDLVVNNVGAPASIYKNLATEQTGRHYLTVTLEGSGANTAGIGTKVVLKHQGTMQMQEQSPTRGWQSSVDLRLHFGLGEITMIDTVLIVWPDGRFQTMTNVAADQGWMLMEIALPSCISPLAIASMPMRRISPRDIFTVSKNR